MGKPTKRKETRNAAILQWFAEGKDKGWIGRRYHITPQRVAAIIKAEYRRNDVA